MKTLINTSNWQGDLDRLGENCKQVEEFLINNHLDGVELIQCGDIDYKRIDKNNIVGLHLPYYPMCMDLFNDDSEGLKRTFGSEDISHRFYNGNREDLIKQYREQLQLARELKVEYVVFHVSHVLVKDCYTYKYEYSDEQVIDATIKFINDVLQGEQYDFYFLLENLWWPGLTFLNNELAEKLLKGIKYDKKGFMLDTGHLMNTNIYLKTEKEAVEYIINILKGMGTLCKYIKGVHLSVSLSGEYVQETKQKQIKFALPSSYEEYLEQYKNTYNHIFKIDHHKPFTEDHVKEIFDYINPEFLVYEFIAHDGDTLEKYIKIQNESLK
ncbi:Xylose isomerase-like TIM barrel [Hathewaya proteolytica DSM 3090]|uniref:Xylose isomerase-like TIM barrel n=1 Tax=Hathewaya proteolytica DSM 3090 TaxID=1121331 RepID=A0A1M6KAS5_9CLOT|nr:TIM barrel protein [Hathewaya proteolytica]SHJ56046.1 Xylose isomerase-like TIM barrel [Hathewaya proteolytica DSM 3090]